MTTKPTLSAKKLSFNEDPVSQRITITRVLTEEEEKERHEAQEEFNNKRTQNICSSVSGVIFFIGAICLFWYAADTGLSDFYIIGAILLAIAIILVILSAVNICRGYHRVKHANGRVKHQEFSGTRKTPPPQPRNASALSRDSYATQSDISIRGLTSPPPSQQRNPSANELYSKAAIKKSDIDRFNSAAAKHEEQIKEEREPNQNLNNNTESPVKNKTVIKLGDNKAHSNTQDDSVIIIHDAEVVLPNPIPIENESNDGNRPAFYLEKVPAHLVDLPGTPDLPKEEEAENTQIPPEFTYTPPHEVTSTKI